MAYTRVIRTYNYVDKDPICDEVANLVDEAGLRGKKNCAKIATLATLATATVENLLYGGTKRPQNRTIMAIATSLGFERRWQRTSNKWDLEEELIKARAFIAAERKKRAKELERERGKKKRKPRKKTKLRLVSARAA